MDGCSRLPNCSMACAHMRTDDPLPIECMKPSFQLPGNMEGSTRTIRTDEDGVLGLLTSAKMEGGPLEDAGGVEEPLGDWPQASPSRRGVVT